MPKKLSASEKRRIMEDLASGLPGFAAQYVEAAFAGDGDAACSLVVAAHNTWRGDIVLAMYLCDVPTEAYREAFLAAWEHDHHEVIITADHPNRLKAMFRKAAVPLPDDMPEVVTLWRGTSRLPISLAAKGISWTLDRDTACFFAVRNYGDEPAPMALVIRSEVLKKDIAYYSNERNEEEVVIWNCGPYIIDGTVDDWMEGCERYEEKQNIFEEEMMQDLTNKNTK